MKILHVLSTNFYSGALSYTLALAKEQAKNHEVFIMTDDFFESPLFNSYPLPISKRSYPHRISNALAIRRFIRKEKINVVHAHSRAASWVTYFAVKGLKIPLISTIHGAQVKHSKYKKQDIYGEAIIAICNNLSQQLIEEINIPAGKIKGIPNGIDDKAIIAANAIERVPTNTKTIALIGRFNGIKGENFAVLLKDVFPVLLENNPDSIIHLIGPEWEAMPQFGRDAFDQLKERYPDRIARFDYQHDIFSFIRQATLVIGGGRIAIEALLLKTPLFSIGEAEMNGIITSENIHEAMASNFGDIKMGTKRFTIDSARVCTEIQAFLDQPTPLHADIEQQIQPFHLSNVVAHIEKIYQAAIIQKLAPNPIPVLMYHKVPDENIETEHKIYVTKDNFKKHLAFFAFRGLKTITFKEYNAFRNGEIDPALFPKKPFILTFDDGYLSNFTNALPLCQKRQFNGVLFLLGDFALRHNNWDIAEQHQAHNVLMDTEQKRAFVEAQWEIGAHTMTHPHLTNLSDQALSEELVQSKRNIERVLNTSVISFAYPFGTYDERVKKHVAKSGFTFGIATDTGGIVIEEDPFAIFRVNIFPHESLFSLYKKTSTWYRAYYKKKRGK